MIADVLNLLAPAALIAFAGLGEDVLALWPRFEALFGPMGGNR